VLGPPAALPPAVVAEEEPSELQIALNKQYGGGKLRRALETLGVDWEQFVTFYDMDPRQEALHRELSEPQCQAVERFLDHRELSVLARELGFQDYESAYQVCTRYLLKLNAPLPNVEEPAQAV